jgi:RHS repeat-associated protein/uncharacterized repeat protein (TIGR01451 family)
LVLPNEDTVLLSPDGRVEVHFPAGAVSRRMRAAFAPQRSKTTDELFYVFQLEMRNLRSQPTAVSFSQPVRVVFHYTKEDLDGLVTPHLRLYRLDEETGDWWPVHGVIDEEAQTLTTHLDHFSIYGIGPSFIRYIPLSMEDWPPSLPITKTASSSTFQAGQLVTYTLTISNPADSTAHFTVTDKLAAGFVYNAELGCDWGKSPGLTGGSPLNLREDGTVLEWTVFDLVAEGTGVLSYTVYAGERAKPLSCNHVVVDPTEGGFTSSRDTHCLWRDLAWWNEGYAYRQPLLINAVQQITATGTSAIEIPLGLVFDTGSLVDEGKLASDGRDLRVVYWGDAGWEELPREIQGLDSITSTLWFPLQDTIEQGLSGDYYVYYGNPWPDSPTQAITQVFGTSSELVAHLNGETTGSEGETGTIGGSGFSWVAEESGFTPASITNTATLTYSHGGAIVPAHGTIALHVKPTWDTDDQTTHYLFQAGQAGSDRLEIFKNSSAEMRFEVVAGGESYEVTEDADLVAGGWSSIVATWDDGGDSAYLYQNGEGTNAATITNTVSGTLDLWLGSQAGGGSSAEALMANLFVYDQALTQAQAESLHRSLLWADIMPQDEEWRGVTSTMTITYEYDPLYRLTGATYSGGAEYQYTYDAVGNRQIMDSPEGEVSYSYDAANRLTSVDGVTYTWDDNGNLTSDGVRSYTYDHANRLTQVTQGSQTTQFAYNGDGDRTSKTVDGDTTQYVLDLATSLPVVVSDTEAVYLYGLDIIAQQQADRQYYFSDGLGSVRQLLDSTGELEANYAYDPFGVPAVAGDAANPYRFTGEAWDAEVELLYLRARYYQPETGRFITMDPWAGNVWMPGTLNRYVYVTNSPVNNVDPGGLNGGGGPGGVCPECKELLHPYEPSGVAGPGKGPLFPDLDQAPYMVTADVDVRVPPISEITLMILLPHESRLTWNPGVVYADWLNYQEHGYSKRASLGLAELLVAYWFFPVPQEHYWFGPEHSLTQDVRHDPAIAWFKERWAQTDPPFKVPFSLPHERDPRSGTWWSQLFGWMLLAQENLELGQCVLGLGSDTAEGLIDPVGGILGSFDMIQVKWAGIGVVRFEVHNTMDRPSATRFPGMNEWMLEDVPRSLTSVLRGDWWGTTIYQHFYWEEPHPLVALAPRSY